MGIIKQLKQFGTNIKVYPITKSSAVYDDTLGRIDNLLKTTVVESDELDSGLNNTPRDADRLDGHLPEYYAKQNDLNLLGYSLEWKKIATIEGENEIKHDFTQYKEIWVDCYCTDTVTYPYFRHCDFLVPVICLKKEKSFEKGYYQNADNYTFVSITFSTDYVKLGQYAVYFKGSNITNKGAIDIYAR